jgi:palmitoyl-protein thioesterase
MLRLLTLSVLLALALGQSNHDFKTCGTDNLGVATVDLNPDQPIPGKNLTVSIHTTPKQDIAAGDKMIFAAKVFGVTVGTHDFDVCTDLGITCPIKSGTPSVLTVTYPIPSAAPGGVPLTAEFTTQTSAGAQYSCIDVQVTMATPPMAMRRSVEPMEATSEMLLESWIQQLLHLEATNPAQLAKELRGTSLAAIAPEMNSTLVDALSTSPTNGIPTVVAHGMGDSCFNPGMKSITKAIGDKTGAYSVCVPTGNNDITDTINGFLKNMDDSIDVFAKKIQADKNLAGGFNAAGFSQGNSLIRGYIHKYNNPPVKSFLSVHGTVMGVGGVPQCNPSGLLSPVCATLAKLCGTFGYTKLIQNHLFQADYFRDPTKLGKESYKNSQLAVINNEGDTPNPDYKTNFGKTEQFVMVKALKDTMVFPNEGEHWGTFADNSFKNVLTMKQTSVYQSDSFGLKTADEAGKINFETTPGNHLQFSEQDLFGWIAKYWAK